MMGIFTELKWGGGVFNQYRAAISGSMCYTIMGAATAWPSPTLVNMENNEAPVNPTVSQISWMVALMFIGHLVSAIPAGYLMDYFGRRKTCLYTSIFPLMSWMLIYCAKNMVYLYFARFFAGVCIGSTTTIMPLYVGEIAVPKLRNSLATINNLLLCFGTLFVYIIGPYVSFYNLALACEILTLLYLVLFFPMPESPYFYVKWKQNENAFKALRWLRKDESEDSILNEIKRIEQSLKEQEEQKGTLKDIFFDRGNRKAFFISATYSCLKRVSGSGVIQAYASVTLPKLTFKVLDPDNCVIIIGAASLLSSMVSAFLAVNIKRKILLNISCAGCTLATAVIMVWFYLDNETSVSVSNFSDLIFLSFVLYFLAFNIGLGPVGTSIKGEIFSSNVKALSSSLTTILVALFGFVMNKIYLLIATSWGMYVNYLVYTMACVFAIFFTWAYVPDTQNKTLEEIREILRRGKARNKGYCSTSDVTYA